MEFRQPDRVPVVFWNCDQTEGDELLYHLALDTNLSVPALREAERMSAVPAFTEKCGDRYRLAGLALSGFTVYTFLRGRQCFMMPISCQTVSISGTPDEIFTEEKRLHRCLGTPEGGFIGYVEEYSVMGMSKQNYCACGEAFRRLR